MTQNIDLPKNRALLLFGPSGPLNSAKASEKANERIQRKVHGRTNGRTGLYLYGSVDVAGGPKHDPCGCIK